MMNYSSPQSVVNNKIPDNFYEVGDLSLSIFTTHLGLLYIVVLFCKIFRVLKKEALSMK
jgi:hypothetical protein